MDITWREALQNRHFILGLAVTGLSLLILAFFMPPFFGEIIGPKKGWIIGDFLLERLKPGDWSWTIFSLIYSCVFLTLATNWKNPSVMAVGLLTYSAVTWLRMLTIYLVTLEAPQGIITLKDPFLSVVVYPGEFVKDLFFSGHISTMTVLILIEPNKKLKWIKVIATVVVAALLLKQHVHYSVDIFFAPLFTYLVYRLAVRFKKPLPG